MWGPAGWDSQRALKTQKKKAVLLYTSQIQGRSLAEAWSSPAHALGDLHMTVSPELGERLW